MIENSCYLGVEFGSTRIKGTVLDNHLEVISNAGYEWKSEIVNHIWTYDLSEALLGFRDVLNHLNGLDRVTALGISGMMHGYLAFDENWKLLTPFRTWQNTITEEAAEKLTDLFQFNVPQRWSIAHLYQAILNDEEHVPHIRHITTLSGYMHYLLTGVNAVGIGEASGMFPVDSEKHGYNEEMLKKFNEVSALDLPVESLLPEVLVAGEYAGRITKSGSAIAGGLLREGIPLAPCEGDAGTGMVATNSVIPETGNVSGGTSIFLMAVMDHPLKKVHSEIDVVATPAGDPVAMVHCNNCTTETNQWVSLFKELLKLEGVEIEDSKLFEDLYHCSMKGNYPPISILNYTIGEGVTHINSGFPLIIRDPGRSLQLSQFMRAHLFSSIATLAIGMRILKEENVVLNRLTAHGGIFKTDGVMNIYLASALETSVSTMRTAGEGGPYGMALLAAYMATKQSNESLQEWLAHVAFADSDEKVIESDPEITKEFSEYLSHFEHALEVEKKVLQEEKTDEKI